MQRIRDSTLKHSVTLGLELCIATIAIWAIWFVQLATWTDKKQKQFLSFYILYKINLHLVQVGSFYLDKQAWRLLLCPCWSVSEQHVTLLYRRSHPDTPMTHNRWVSCALCVDVRLWIVNCTFHLPWNEKKKKQKRSDECMHLVIMTENTE